MPDAAGKPETDTPGERSLREMFRRSRRGEIVAIVASGLAGLLSLLVSTYNVYLQRAQVRAQVWPHLEWTYNNAEGGFVWNVNNTGVGPARIEGMRLSREGVPFKNWDEAWATLTKEYPRLAPVHGASHSTTYGRVLPPGGVIPAVTFRDPEGLEDGHQELTRALTSIRMEICYCSTLDDCWLFSDESASESPVASCRRPELTFRD
jgi:hypothetical protein